MLTTLAAALLPGAPHLRLETIAFAPSTLTVQLRSMQAHPTCPDCGQVAQRRHSAYIRTLADLPWADLAARIHLRVRRFFCDHLACARFTFTERLPALVAPYARRTLRLTQLQTDVALALGGAAGARLTTKQHMPASRNTLLRLIRRLPLPAVGAPRVVGVDDWAKRKGQIYGSIIVDLETHRPLDLLDDRLAETIEAWLKAYPTVEVISRDRAEAYAAGATAGAPNAVQVADRFHIIKNLCTAIEEELSHCGVRIGRSASEETAAPPVQPDLALAPSASASLPAVPPTYPDSPAGRRDETVRQARRRARFAQYTQVLALRAAGVGQATIARRVGIGRRTVQRWLAADGFPERKPRSGDTSSLDPYKVTLLDRWQAGCHNGRHLWRMLQVQGFAGSYEIVADYRVALRRGEAPRVTPTTRQPAKSSGRNPSYSAREAAFLLLRRPTELTALEQHDLTQVQDPNVVQLHQITQAFATMVRERDATRLDGWLDSATSSDFPALRQFANGIRRDYAAVRAGLTLPYSQGAVEGHITRLKLIKRQMFGRAKLDLLRRRVLLAA